MSLIGLRAAPPTGTAHCHRGRPSARVRYDIVGDPVSSTGTTWRVLRGPWMPPLQNLGRFVGPACTHTHTHLVCFSNRGVLETGTARILLRSLLKVSTVRRGSPDAEHEGSHEQWPCNALREVAKRRRPGGTFTAGPVKFFRRGSMCDRWSVTRRRSCHVKAQACSDMAPSVSTTCRTHGWRLQPNLGSISLLLGKCLALNPSCPVGAVNLRAGQCPSWRGSAAAEGCGQTGHAAVLKRR